ncbi:efflux transporter outer membrane subunit [Pseudomonas sp. S75]|uniref:efflux transporter outer membrane subunit n=1 Tax=unclassified Pseudomonas TaxID=196821 RepID=UPI001904625D|nr:MULTISPECIES: efflux transporter outer membrane subunit [unclassified Pseudomonas]MBJ9975801.1 efflux transporter outer membrane subunit [Pseudomonas sp. S30]MBK0154759.1 efflux transporter outer membrane subunit [Pseudomonas sp. S75]
MKQTIAPVALRSAPLPQRGGFGAPRYVTLVLLAALLAGCTLGPDFQRPDSQAPQRWAAIEGQQAASQPVVEPLQVRWWDSFHDARLSALIEQVAARNLDLQMASARLLQSRAQRSSVAADQTPSLAAQAGYSRARNSAEGLNDPSGNSGKSAYDLWQGDLVAGWELDLWGRVRRQVEAADANVEVAENDRNALLLALLAETAGDYIQLRAVQHTLQVTEDNLDVARHSLKLSEQRQAEGVATRLDVAQASAQVATIEARLPTLQARRDDLINALSLLAAEPPRRLQASLAAPAELPAPQQRFAIGVPSELAQRRPDIRQAEARLHAATASIGVAKADFYPSIRLSGSAGLQSMQLADFGAWSARRFSVGPQLSLPIFEGGRLQGQLQLREAQQQEAALNYRQVVLAAWHEIDDVLRLYNASQLRRDHLAEAVRQNRVALETAQRQYVEGAVDFLNVLSVQSALLASQEQWIDSSAAVSQALVGLYKALGGGWQAFDQG